MDNWSPEDFLTKIYNEQYDLIDVGHHEDRPIYNLNRLLRNFNILTNYSYLDYGGGNDFLCSLIKDGGASIAHTFDPYSENNVDLSEKYDFITAFEVMERSTDPISSFQEVFSFEKPESIIVVGTSCAFDWAEDDYEKRLKNFSYNLPRAGHISIYSLRAMQIIAERFNLKLHHLDDGYHIFFNPAHHSVGSLLKPGAY